MSQTQDQQRFTKEVAAYWHELMILQHITGHAMHDTV